MYQEAIHCRNTRYVCSVHRAKRQEEATSLYEGSLFASTLEVTTTNLLNRQMHPFSSFSLHRPFGHDLCLFMTPQAPRQGLKFARKKWDHVQ